ncbi:MAG: LAGLIDADG family homing endonuclease [Candidatus ainarchaeum sp.]|nr:LAGLIDADG family homing endonuclease [Candidatus ainarchaeum sp.]
MSIEILKKDEIVVIYHYDADGLTSGAIIIKALEREGKKTSSLCLKQLYKENINEIKLLGKNFLFVDFGSGQIDYLKKEFCEENLFILDHHQPITINGKIPVLKYHINPFLYGFDGGKEISGAGLAFFFAITLNKNNFDLSALAIVGAVGDMQDFDGKLVGLNRKILDIAVKEKVVSVKNDLRLYGRISRPLISYLVFSSSPIIPNITANEENCIAFLKTNNIPLKNPFTKEWLSYEDLSQEDKQKLSSALIIHLSENMVPEWKIQSLIGEVYTLEKEELKSPLKDAKEFATACNSAGRHSMPEIALQVCLGNRDKKSFYGKLLLLIEEHKRELKKGIEFVKKNGIIEKNSFYFFDAKDVIQDSLVGIIAGMLYGSIINEDKPIIAFARNEDGTIKVSGRATSQLLKKGVNLGLAFKKISNEINGVEGGGHCLHPDTLVQKSNGIICKISEIKKSDTLIGMKKSKLIRATCNKTFKIKKDKTIFFKTPNTNIIASYNHRFFIYKNFKIIEVMAKDLKEKDFVLGVKKIYFKGRKIKLENNSFVYLKETGILEFKKKRLLKGLTRNQLNQKLTKKIQTVGNLADFENLFSHRILENCLYDYLKILGINKQKFLKKFVEKHFQCNVKNLNKQIAWLVGYIQGDGNIGKKRIECKEPSEQILDTFENYIYKNFNLNSTRVDMKTYKKIRVYSADLCRFFEFNFPETKLLTGKLKVPKKIMQGSNEILAFYLRGLFDADGGVFDRFVHLDMIDKHLLETVQLLLLRFGILSGLRKSASYKSLWNCQDSYRLDITDFDSLKKFANEIGFTKDSKKQNNLNRIIKKQVIKKRNSMLFSPITYGDARQFIQQYNLPRKIFDPQLIYNRTKNKRMNYTTLKTNFINPLLKTKIKIEKEALEIIKTFNNLCYKGNFRFGEIKKIKVQNNSSKLFDLSVPKTKNFLANSLIVHNSVAAGCKVPIEKEKEFLILLDEIISKQLLK